MNPILKKISWRMNLVIKYKNYEQEIFRIGKINEVLRKLKDLQKLVRSVVEENKILKERILMRSQMNKL